MSSKNWTSILPLPQETILEYSSRQPHSFRSRPPKLPPKLDTSFNRLLNCSISSAQAISFKDNSGSSDLLSSIYNKDSDESYFEQCFDVVCKIGEGSFGEVFKVRSKEDGLFYAVKKSKKLIRSTHYRQERLEEVRRYEQFSEHEHCVKLYKAWEQDDRLFMQMELCRESLEHYLSSKGHIPESEIWSILFDLLLALKSLHDKNLIHLDIKLDNILITDDGICKLGDFGLVVDIDKANTCQTTEGDSRYIASEIMQGYFSKSADIFSLGITMLELSCNLELPSHGPLWQELRLGILPQNFLMKISSELQYVIKSMMDPIPSKRPTVDQLLSHKRIKLEQRVKRWGIVKKIKKSYKKVTRFLWTKVCNFKNVINQFLISFLAVFRVQRVKKIKIKIDDEVLKNEEFFQQSDDNDNVKFETLSTANIQFHSTPLCHNSVNLRKTKKYFTRDPSSPTAFSTSSCNLNESAFDDEIHIQPSICKQLLFSDDYIQ